MTDEIVRLEGDALKAELRTLVERAAEYRQARRSEATLLAYGKQFRKFVSWCDQRQLPSLPTEPKVVTVYVGWLADRGHKISTIGQAVSAIGYEHRRLRLPWDINEDLKEMMDGLRRKVRVRPVKKAPIEDILLRKMVTLCDDSLLGIRDRAILLVGWVSACRRSEIVALDVADAQFREEGLVILLRVSKTDQEGEGYEKALPYSASGADMCPVRSLRRWLEASGITEGPIFRRLGRGQSLGTRLSDKSVARMIKARVKAAGCDEKLFSGHSLRAGFVTTAYRQDRQTNEIMRQTGHRCAESLVGYERQATIFKKNAASGLL